MRPQEGLDLALGRPSEATLRRDTKLGHVPLCRLDASSGAIDAILAVYQPQV